MLLLFLSGYHNAVDNISQYTKHRIMLRYLHDVILAAALFVVLGIRRGSMAHVA